MRVNWYRVYEAFIIVHVVVGVITNQTFREWLLYFALITIIIAFVMVLDRRKIH